MMEDRRIGGAHDNDQDSSDVEELCPNCGHRGERRKCKLICTNPRCGTHIIMACVD